MGRPMSEFWELTPREFGHVCEGYLERVQESQALEYYNAYHAGFFSQSHKKFPDYNKFAPKGVKQPVRQQTPEQMKAIAMALCAALGGVKKDG